jgi:hypothetical protein
MGGKVVADAGSISCRSSSRRESQHHFVGWNYDSDADGVVAAARWVLPVLVVTATVPVPRPRSCRRSRADVIEQPSGMWMDDDASSHGAAGCCDGIANEIIIIF